MYTMNEETFRTLAMVHEDACISLFMPVYGAAPDIKQDQIRLKNLVHEAERRCRNRGIRDTQTNELLEPLRTRLEDPFLWEKRKRGLAIFRSNDLFRFFHIPETVEELCIVNDRFHLKPILPLVGAPMPFFLLALDLNGSTLYRCDRYRMEQTPLERTPRNLAEAMRYDDPERQLQFHTGTPTGPGKRAAIFHGQGVGVDDTRHKSDIRRFFAQLQKGVHAVLKEEDAPLVLAGVEYLHPLYAETNTYEGLVDDGVFGSPSSMTEQELHRRAVQRIQEIYDRRRDKAFERYRELAGTPRTTDDVEEVVRAALFGRVETLFAARDRHMWGDFDSRTGKIIEEETSGNDLIDLAAKQTLLHGGTLHMVSPERVPGESALAALLRY